ncbi:HAMP domain-containing protein [Methylobacterium sp. C25]|uniref:sensor histidine kinase n=1 Tax=Methylobacterium sp. C25 TaxID=2721622 RepID=UPI001F2E1B89|nr:histidine kinase [Methylobacterium sp. C25]MCE4226942.1 HAMP domain-containing protein [Methylobacterium sp. C25]
MRLLTRLILQVLGVVLLCLTCATSWVMIDAARGIENEAAASADRVVRQTRELAWREAMWRGSTGRDAKYAFPDWRGSDTIRVISPGYCVSFTWSDEAPRRLCGGWSNIGAAPPAWFDTLFQRVFGPIQPVTRSISMNGKDAGTVVAEADVGVAARQAWRAISVVIGVAASLAAAIGMLSALIIGRALQPAETIVRGLRQLERGDHSVRLPAFKAFEFGLIARAVNDLTERLAETTAQRTSLTRRLFEVQEEERRALARDLHDEFGQCLTATGALAAAVAAGAQNDRPDIAEDGVEIGRITERMMGTLRSTLARLRPPDLDEVGLEQSLDHLVTQWNARSTAVAQTGSSPRHPVFRLDIIGSLTEIPAQAAVSLYRIAQECLTNAARHGKPSEVRLRVERDPRSAVRLIVEDDGGGDPARLREGTGHGLLGIRERLSALGGSMTIGSVETAGRRGVRVATSIPLSLPAGMTA